MLLFCLYRKHDQGWKERPIFGKVRYMNEAGLKRKFRMDAYVCKVKTLVAEYGLPADIDNSSASDLIHAEIGGEATGGVKTKRKTLDAFWGKDDAKKTKKK